MELAENGASLKSWNNINLFWMLDALREPNQTGEDLDDSQIYVCLIPKSNVFSSCNHFANKSSHHAIRYADSGNSAAVEK